ncbi:nuclear transport factor 2 family protein [Burkholderiaceae bacterium FT117]|uniref:nuclear transport factor 2 family protein n=1 Tax=Zeimonas sediminis TaxID=2944268 RepID=UPI002342FE14|nr:nuclear transport factor 2 family protein [Zeimonas sediminis]MCM5570813.1 nuclear transport factor 2 family protein [Zeimonas sediminis]
MAPDPALPVTGFTPEQRELWQHVVGLWAVSQGRNEALIRATLHPDYVGWDISAPLPHDREAAVRSVSGDSPDLREYELHPLSVRIYDGKVGVVHYAWRATVVPLGAAPVEVTGNWSEVYLRQDGAWTMVSVSGRPDPSAAPAGPTDPGSSPP